MIDLLRGAAHNYPAHEMGDMPMTLKEIAALYLESKRNAWAPTTLKSEAARLNTIVELCDGKPAADCFLVLARRYQPYALVTAWTRLSALYDFGLQRGLVTGFNVYARYREENERLFKHAYTRRPAPVTFAEIERRLTALPASPAKEKIQQMLANGLRYAESLTHRNGQVIGKGDKIRNVLDKNGPEVHASYSTVRRACQLLGIKPHDLRKAFATELARRGCSISDICTVMGWSSVETALCYIRARDLEEIRRRLVG